MRLLQFNLETPDPEIFKEHTRIYRSISSAQTVPIFQLQVLLCIPELATNQVLVYLAQDSSRVRIDPTPRYIVLESWNLEYSPHPHGQPYTQDVAPSTMYKHGIPLFRSIFTLLRVMPAWKLARRLRRRVGGNRGGNFSIQLRVDSPDSSVRTDEVMSFGELCVIGLTSIPTTLFTSTCYPPFHQYPGPHMTDWHYDRSHAPLVCYSL